MMTEFDMPAMANIAKLVAKNPAMAAKALAESGMDPDMLFSMGQPGLGELAGGDEMASNWMTPQMGRMPGVGAPAGRVVSSGGGAPYGGGVSGGAPDGGSTAPNMVGAGRVPGGAPGGVPEAPNGLNFGTLDMGRLPQPVGLPPPATLQMMPPEMAAGMRQAAQTMPAPSGGAPTQLMPAPGMPPAQIMPAPAGGAPVQLMPAPAGGNGMIGPWETTVNPAAGGVAGQDPTMSLLLAGLKTGMPSSADQRPVFGANAPNPGFNPRAVGAPQSMAMLQQLLQGGGLPPSLGSLMG